MRKRKMPKKAILFTIITIFLLTSVFVLTTTHIKRNRLYQTFVSQVAISAKTKFIQEDVISDYLTLLDITLDEISRNSTSITLKFSNFSLLSQDINYSARLADYENFLETTFSSLSNTKIVLNMFTPVFNFYPYNSTFSIEGKQLYFYSADYAKLNSIDIEVKAYRNETDPTISEPIISCGVNCVSLILKVTAENGTILKSETYVLDPVEENLPVLIRYPTIPESNLTIEFGKHTERVVGGSDIITEGTLHIDTNNLMARITKLYIDYDTTSKNTVLQTNATIYIE